MNTSKYILFLSILVFLLAACVPAKGKYRMPYLDGTQVKILTDASTHSTPEASMYDMVSTEGIGLLAAAAGGWVRHIEDSHSNVGSSPNNYVWIEHPYPFCQDPNDVERANWPGKPQNYDETCTPCTDEYCNEWTVYAHMATDSVTGNGWFQAALEVDDWVEPGQFIGVESNIGFTPGGRHLHWFVVVVDPDIIPDADGYYKQWLNDENIEEPERVPVVCHADADTMLSAGLTYTASDCL